MKATRALAVLLVLVVTSAPSARSDPEMSPLAVGQVWTIKKSPGPDTRIVIGRIEGEVVHVSIFDIPVPLDYPLRKGPISIGHSPFGRAAISMSIEELLGTNGKMDQNFESGYEEWKSANGGYFTISVSEAIAATLEAVTKGRRK